MTKLFYVGRRFASKDNRVHHMFAENAEQFNSYTYYPKAKASHFIGARIGHLYEFPDGKFPEVWKSIGEAPDSQKLEWQVQDRATSARANEMKHKPDDELMACVKKLSRARHSLTPPQKGAFDAWLLNQLKGDYY